MPIKSCQQDSTSINVGFEYFLNQPNNQHLDWLLVDWLLPSFANQPHWFLDLPIPKS